MCPPRAHLGHVVPHGQQVCDFFIVQLQVAALDGVLAAQALQCNDGKHGAIHKEQTGSC